MKKEPNMLGKIYNHQMIKVMIRFRQVLKNNKANHSTNNLNQIDINILKSFKFAYTKIHLWMCLICL